MREALVVVIVSVGIGLAVPSAQTAQPITQSLRSAWDSAKKNIQESATAMPDDKYGFRPVATVRSFGEIIGHIAGANYVFCSSAKGEKSPHAEEAFEKLPTKPALIKALADSVAYCDAAFVALDDRKAAETVDLPFGQGKGARASALLGNVGHLNEHYGNLVTYFRINGIVPPSSR